MINSIPILGWLISAFSAISLAVPFWFVWTVCGIGEKFFDWLPAAYHAPGFWSCVGLFVAADVLKWALFPRWFFFTGSTTR